MIFTFAFVLAWYVQNEQAGADRSKGLLALKPEPELNETDAPKQSYRQKVRVTPRQRGGRANVIAPPKTRGESRLEEPSHSKDVRRKFRRQDDVRYRVKDKKPRDQWPPKAG